jgi:hypothetical protein
MWSTNVVFDILTFSSRSDEIAKRTAVFTVAGQVGKMFAGAMMAAIHESMDGRGGLAGWQWVFLIDGIISKFESTLQLSLLTIQPFLSPCLGISSFQTSRKSPRHSISVPKSVNWH